MSDVGRTLLLGEISLCSLSPSLGGSAFGAPAFYSPVRCGQAQKGQSCQAHEQRAVRQSVSTSAVVWVDCERHFQPC